MPEIVKVILIAAGILGGIGALLGAVLSLISKVFSVQEDPRSAQITAALPGANCGGCGYAGCSAYAQAIVSEGAPINACHSGGQPVADQIAHIMGVSAQKMERRVAFVRCSGTADYAVEKYVYRGILDCNAAMRLQNGPKQCAYACLGLGSCAAVCPEAAITVSNGVASVSAALCGGCGKCATVCPRRVIDMIPETAAFTVGCSSESKGVQTKKDCSAGCIGCRLCEKNCPEGAIAVTNNVAKIDYEKCTGCGQCAEKCPVKIIRRTV